MKVSAAKIGLMPACSYWAREDVVVPEQPPTEPADTGKATHSFIESWAYGSMPEIPILADVTKTGKLFNTWKEWWPAYSCDRAWRYEIPLIYDWKTGKAREEKRDWVKGSRERGPTEIPVVVDALGSQKILDWKTGSKRESSADSWQLRIAALAAHLLFGWESIEVGLVYLRIRKIEKPELATYDAMDLLSFAGEIRALMAARNDAQPKPGDHCFRCSLRQRGEDGESLCPGLRVDMGRPPDLYDLGAG